MSTWEAKIFEMNFCLFWSWSLSNSFDSPKSYRSYNNARQTNRKNSDFFHYEEYCTYQKIENAYTKRSNGIIDKKCYSCFSFSFFPLKSKKLIKTIEWLWKKNNPKRSQQNDYPKRDTDIDKIFWSKIEHE